MQHRALLQRGTHRKMFLHSLENDNRNSRRRRASNEEVSNRNKEGTQERGGKREWRNLDIAEEASRHRCHRAVRLSIHFIHNAFAITLRCPGHGL